MGTTTHSLSAVPATRPRGSRCMALGLLAAAGLTMSCTLTAPDQRFDSELHAFRVVTVVDGLEHPWSMAFLPNGDLLVTERAGRLRIVRNGILQTAPIAGTPPVRVGGQGGLFDVVLHPAFANNGLVYLSYAKAAAEGNRGTTAVVRGRLEGDALMDVEEIFEALLWTAGNGHYGGRLAFDRDGYLFISLGDRQAPPSGALEAHPAQDLGNHFGTLIRLHDDGRVPEDNPFASRAGARAEIYSYGHRNIQGLAIHPDTGDVWLNEHGPQGGDELNRALPGRNYGWPVIGYGVNYGFARTPIHASAAREGMEQPAHYWVPSIAPAGLMIYTGDEFPHWRGNLFSGGMSDAHRILSRIALDGTHVASEEKLLPGEFRIRDVRQGPDGYIYLATDSRLGLRTPIVRLEPL